MASFSQTYSGDFTSFIAGKIFDIISDAKSERAKADKEAAKYGVDVKFTPGEFTARSARNQFIGATLGKKFVPKTKYPDLLARGQFSSDPLMGTPTHVRGLPEYQKLANPNERKFRESLGKKPQSTTTTQKPIKVQDEKLGVFLAAVVKSLNLSIDSINKRLDETESGLIEAKEGVFGTIKQLEYNSDILDTKLDAIIEALREQNLFAKKAEDQQEVGSREAETEKEFDLADVERIVKPDEKKDETIQLNIFEDMRERAEKREEQLSLPLVGGSEGFERGGIASGPDSGYLAKLHGDEMIIPLDNNATQGEESAVTGVVGPKPPMLSRAYEQGTEPSQKQVEPQISASIPNILGTSADIEDKTPKIMDSMEKLHDAMDSTIQSSGIVTMGVLQNAISSMGPLASGVAPELGAIGDALAASFGISNSINASVTRRTKTDRETSKRKQATKSFNWKDNEKTWWNPLTWFGGDKNGEGGGYRKGGGTRIERYSNDYGGGLRPGSLARGTRAGVGFTGMNAQGFNAMMQGQNYIPSSKPQILGHGAYSAPTLRGAERYAGTSGSLGGRQAPGGVVRSIVPSGAPRINFLEPQAKTTPEMFNKGRDLATKLMDPNYRPNSATANRLRSGMRTGGIRPPAPRGGLTLKSLTNPLQLLGELIWNELSNPQAAGSYDQVTGPNAMYNNPKLSEERRRILFESVHGPGTFGNKAAIVNMSSQDQALSRFNKQTRQPDPIIINNQTAEDFSADVPQSHISNMGDPGFSALYPSPR